MIEYTIAKNKHLPMILELYKQLNTDETPIDINIANKIWDKIYLYDIKYFIAIENNKVISSCYLSIIPNLTRGGKSIGFIENVITDKNYRQKGIGRALIKMAVEHGKVNNCYKIILQSGSARKESHIFYEKCGFEGDSKRAFELRF